MNTATANTVTASEKGSDMTVQTYAITVNDPGFVVWIGKASDALDAVHKCVMEFENPEIVEYSPEDRADSSSESGFWVYEAPEGFDVEDGENSDSIAEVRALPERGYFRAASVHHAVSSKSLFFDAERYATIMDRIVVKGERGSSSGVWTALVDDEPRTFGLSIPDGVHAHQKDEIAREKIAQFIYEEEKNTFVI